jgi:hypothetical protein
MFCTTYKISLENVCSSKNIIKNIQLYPVLIIVIVWPHKSNLTLPLFIKCLYPQVTYVCNNNYNLTGGSITQSCTAHGYWRGRKPSCLCMYIIKQCLYRKHNGIEYSVIRPTNYRNHILRKEKMA